MFAAEFYKKFKESHARAKDFEIVFVSSDRDQGQVSKEFTNVEP